ncbi:TPA: transcriptional repressor, partial [Clostridium botulinum]
KVIEVKDDFLEDLEENIEEEYNFKIENHSLKFYGICKECQGK